MAQTTIFEDYAEGRLNKQEYLARKREISIQQQEAEKRYVELSEQMAVKMEQEQKKSKCTTCDLEKYTLAEEVTREILEEFVQVIK